MKSDRGGREALPEPGDLEMLGWILRRRKLRRGDEAEAMIVTRIAEEHTPPGAVLAQCLKARPYDLAANAAPFQCTSVERSCVRSFHGLDCESAVEQAGWALRTMPEILHQENRETEDVLLPTVRLRKHSCS